MIDTDNLRTASLYINNQLLSRGLLRDGQSIDFANPFKGDDDGTIVMGRIMSVVNDLILRRDVGFSIQCALFVKLTHTARRRTSRIAFDNNAHPTSRKPEAHK